MKRGAKAASDPAPLCAPVQLVVRLQKRGDDGTIQVRVGFDLELYNLLGKNLEMDHASRSERKRSPPLRRRRVINQALLRYHEAAGILGFGLGQSDTTQVRRHSVNILSADVHQRYFSWSASHPVLSQGKPGLEALMMNFALLTDGFADYPFAESSRIPPGKFALQQASKKLQEELLGQAHAFDSLPLDDMQRSVLRGTPFCSVSSTWPMSRRRRSRWWPSSRWRKGRSIDFYALVDPEIKDDKELKAVCGYAQKHGKPPRVIMSEDDLAIPILFESARAYCRSR